MSLMIAIPSYDGKLGYDTVRGLTQTAHYCGRNQIGFSVQVRPHDAFIGKARSALCMQFLRTEFHDLLFVDADIGFDVGAVGAICRAPCDIALGLYRLKVEGPEEAPLVKYPALMCDPIERHEEDPLLIRLQYGPCGFMRIRRPVLEAMMQKWPDEHFSDESGDIHDFFPCGRLGNHFMGEDIGFCNRARECGFPLYGVQGLHLRHYGEKRWESRWQIDVPVVEEKKEAA